MDSIGLILLQKVKEITCISFHRGCTNYYFWMVPQRPFRSRFVICDCASKMFWLLEQEV